MSFEVLSGYEAGLLRLKWVKNIFYSIFLVHLLCKNIQLIYKQIIN